MAKSYLKGLSGEGTKKGHANYGKNKGAQNKARREEGKTRKKEAAKRVAKQQAVNYPRDPGARAQLEGSSKRKAERKNREITGTSTKKDVQIARRKALTMLLNGQRRFKTQQERAIENQIVVPYASKKPSKDIRDITKDSREEQRRALATKDDSVLDNMEKTAKKYGLDKLWNIKKAADLLIAPIPTLAWKVGTAVGIETGKQGVKAISKAGKPSAKGSSTATVVPATSLAGAAGDIYKAGKKTVTAVPRTLAQGGKDAATIVDLTARPSYALSAGVGAALKDEDIDKAMGRGLAGKERGGYSKVLKDQGAPKKWYTDVAGFALDVALDPSTYVSFGAAPVATKAGNKAAAKVGKIIAQEGTEAVAKKLGMAVTSTREEIQREVRDRVTFQTAAKIGHNRKGIQVHVGTKGKLGWSSSGRATAKLNKVLGGSAASTKIRDTKAVQFIGKNIAPDFRPKGVSPRAWAETRHSVTRVRGATDKGTAEGARLQRAARKAGLTEEDFFLMERGGTNDKIKGLEKIFARDLDRKTSVGILEDGWEVDKLPKIERGRILDAYKTQTKKVAKAIDDEKYVLEKVQKEKLQAQIAGDTEEFDRLLAAQARTEQRLENLEATRDALRDLKVERQMNETWTEYTERLMRETRHIAPDLSKYAETLREAQKLGPRKYIPHVANKNIEPIEDITTYVPRAGSSTASPEHERALMYSVENARKTSPTAQAPDSPNSFSTELGDVLRYQANRTSTNVALAKHWDHVAKHAGRKVKKGEDLTKIPDDWAVYAVGKAHPGHISKPYVNTDLQDLARITKDPEGYVILPRELVNDSKRMLQPSAIRRLQYGKQAEKFSGSVKALYTKWNIPSHHVINQIGDLLFMTQANTPVLRGLKDATYLKRAHLARNKAEHSGDLFRGGDFEPEILAKTHKVGQIEQPLGKWLDEIEQYDILTQGHIGREITETTGKQTWFNRFLAGREDIARLGTYMHARGKGMLPEDAAAHVSKHHINYNDLTEMEKMLRAMPVPFITFLARNTRIQMSQLFQRPGKFANVAKALNTAARLSGYEDYMDFYDQLKDYQQAELLLPIGEGKPVNLQLPIALGLDLASLNLDRIATTALSGLFMPFKAAIELKLNKQIFNNRALVEEVPYSGGKKRGGLTTTGPLTGWPLDKIGVAQKNSKGEYVIPAKLQYLLNQSPQSSTIGRAGYEGSGGRTWLETLASQLGAKTQPAPDKKAKAKDVSYKNQEKLGTAYERAKELYGEDDPRTIAAKTKFNQAKKKNRPPSKASGGKDPLAPAGSSGGGSGYGGI